MLPINDSLPLTHSEQLSAHARTQNIKSLCYYIVYRVERRNIPRFKVQAPLQFRSSPWYSSRSKRRAPFDIHGSTYAVIDEAYPIPKVSSSIISLRVYDTEIFILPFLLSSPLVSGELAWGLVGGCVPKAIIECCRDAETA